MYSFVRFKDPGDYLLNATDLGLSASDTFTFACHVRKDGFPGGGCVVSWGVLDSIGFGNFGNLVPGVHKTTFYGPSPPPYNTSGFTNLNPSWAIVPGETYTVHLVARHSTNTVRLWVNGVEDLGMTGPNWFGSEFLPPAGMAIAANWGAPELDVLRWTGEIGLIWFDYGQYIDDPSAFYPPKDLGDDMSRPGGVQPAVAFGGRQTLRDWLEGRNLGYATGQFALQSGTIRPGGRERAIQRNGARRLRAAA